MFYFDKENPEVLFADNRELQTTLCDGRSLLIKPDVNMDFRNMPYPDNTFKIVVFDPPHLLHAGARSWLAQKYGILPKEWKVYLKAGFQECMRVLETNGILVFKWNDDQIQFSEVLKVFKKKAIARRPTRKNKMGYIFKIAKKATFRLSFLLWKIN